MKKLITLFFLILIITVSFNSASAVNPAYTLKVTNFIFSDSIGNGGYDQMQFDIYILHTNVGASGNFEYALGSFYMNLNSALGVSANYNYYIVSGSTQFTNPNAVPRSPAYVNTDATSPSGASLRLANNMSIMVGSGAIISTVSPGTRVCTVRLKKKSGSFPIVPINMLWRTALPNPFTKIFAYIGGLSTEVTSSGTYSIDSINLLTSMPQQITPSNNSVNIPTSVNLKWNKISNAINYRLRISTDSLFTTTFKDTNNVTDTSVTFNGFTFLTKYYWKVTASGTINNLTSAVWNFTIRAVPVLKLKLTVIPEGMYYPIFNQLSRRDTATVELYQNTPPYNFITSKKAVIDSLNFTSQYTFNNVYAGTYYIVVNHFNSIAIWSKSGGETFNETDTLVYNFTSAAAKTYGNNVKLKGGKYCMYSGDVNQSGFIDGSDISDVENGAFFSTQGRYIPEDLNADAIVDAADINIIDVNSGSGSVAVRRPK